MIKPSHLLVVDPDKTVGASVTKRLKDYGFTVRSVDTGEKAIEVASREKPDLIVVDIKLPGMSSFELSGRLRALANDPDVPVLLIGSHTEIKNTVGVASKYIIDSVEILALPKRIHEIVAAHRRQRAIEQLVAQEGIATAPEGTQELTTSEQDTLRRIGAPLESVELGSKDPELAGQMDYVNLLESSLTTAQASRLLGVNESRIRQRLTSRPTTMYGIKRDSEWVIPSFQFHGKKLVPNIGRVIAKLDPRLHPVSVWRWFKNPDPDLSNAQSPDGGFSPLDWLIHGYPVEAVEKLAEDLHLS